jgi:hypothetical protein
MGSRRGRTARLQPIYLSNHKSKDNRICHKHQDSKPPLCSR